MRRNRIAQISIGLLTALLLAAAAPGTAAAEKTDILLLVDTTGSMGTALQPAVEDVQEITERVRGELGDVSFGVAQVRDYPIEDFFAEPTDRPYQVVQPITGDSKAVANALDSLVATGGGDGPEAYGRALRDADVGGGLGWRGGARRLVVMVADDVPHDDDLNWGIPSAVQTRPTPFDTLRDPGDDQIVGTGDDIDWQGLMTQLAEHGLPLMLVLFEGEEELLPYWETWAGWTGGAAVSGDAANLADRVVDLAKRGATAKLPECPVGQTRDEARRCRPYTDWLGYSFQNGDLPKWASNLGLGRDDVLTKDLVARTFSDVEYPAWWMFWRRDPRAAWWDMMEGGVCYGMAIGGGRFSTALQPFRSAPDGRTAASWEVARTPQLPAPAPGVDGTYGRELLQTIATDFVSQKSTEAQAAILDQLNHFGSRAGSGGAAAAMRSQLEAVMSGGRGNVGRSSLASERGVGLATVVFYGNGGGHAVVAYRVRDAGGGAFNIDVWDNNNFGKNEWIAVHSDGSWDYGGGLNWHGNAGQNIAFLPVYPARGLHLTEGGTSASGRAVTVADIPPGASDVRVKAETEKGAPTEAYVLPVPTAGPDGGSTAVADGSRLQVSLNDKGAGAIARGHGTILSAQGLTGGGGGGADISFDVDQGSVAARSPLAGELAVTHDALQAVANGASSLSFADSGAVTLRARKGGAVTLALAAAAGDRVRSTTLTVRMPRRGLATIGAAQAKRAIRRGGPVRVRVGRGRKAETVVATARSIAASYGLRAHVRVKRKRAKLTLTADRRLPGDAEAEVVWTARRGKRVLGRRSVSLARVRTGRRLAGFAIPAGMKRGEVEAVVRVLVRRPGPARLVARDSVSLR